MKTRGFFVLPFVPATICTLLVVGCMTTTSNTDPNNTDPNQSSFSCSEFDPSTGLAADVKVDARVRAFAQSSVDLGVVAANLKTAVKTACIGIASDLGATDTWTPMGESDDAIGNAAKTGACDAARERIVSLLRAHKDANFALVISRGECHPDFDEQVRCEAGCSPQQKCDPGTVETRCDPAQLSVVCEGSCSAQAVCEGRADAEASCEGRCEAECTGHCSGRCDQADGRHSDDDPNCHGKCNAHCSGKCTGHCKVEAPEGIQCGANVSCKGGCASTFSAAKCETECTPPKCTIDQSCFESCRASASAKAICEPPTVKLFADTSTADDVAKIVATIEKNLPPLIQSAEAQGRFFVDEVQSLSASGKALLQASGDLDFKSLSCATAAAESLGKTGATLQVSTQAGADVTSDCSSNAD
jgi:hypothetical protein